jgi:hypothetical protein
MTTHRRAAGILGLISVVALIANIAFTADGPRPNATSASELARVLDHAMKLRVSALLGVGQALAMTAFLLLLALLSYQQRRTAAATVSVAAAVYAATAFVSFAALAAATQAAQTGLGAGVLMGLGSLHTTTLLMAILSTGVALIAVGSTSTFGRIGSWSARVIGACGIVSVASILSVKFDTGPAGLFVFIAFIGTPIWLIAVSIKLLLRPAAATPS